MRHGDLQRAAYQALHRSRFRFCGLYGRVGQVRWARPQLMRQSLGLAALQDVLGQTILNDQIRVNQEEYL